MSQLKKDCFSGNKNACIKLDKMKDQCEDGNKEQCEKLTKNISTNPKRSAQRNINKRDSYKAKNVNASKQKKKKLNKHVKSTLGKTYPSSFGACTSKKEIEEEKNRIEVKSMKSDFICKEDTIARKKKKWSCFIDEENSSPACIDNKYYKCKTIFECVKKSSVNMFEAEYGSNAIEVPYNSDFKTLSKVMTDIAFSATMGCLVEKSKELKKAGKTPEEIATFFSDEKKREAEISKCFCSHRDIFSNKVQTIEKIMQRNPLWRNNKLVHMRENGGNNIIDASLLKDIKNKLNSCN